MRRARAKHRPIQRVADLRFYDFSLTLPATLELRSTRVGAGEHEITAILDRGLHPRVLHEQLAAAGFELLAGYGSSAGFSLTAARADTTVYMTFSGPPQRFLYVCASSPAAHADLALGEDCFTWDDVRWPAYFLDGKLACVPSDDETYITARVHPEQDLVERYRAWALRSGFEVEEPLNAWEDEPDLRVARGLRFRAARFVARFELDGELVMLYIARRAGE